MKLRDDLPSWVGWTIRTIAYGISLAIMGFALVLIARARIANNGLECMENVSVPNGPQPALLNAKAIDACLKQKSGFFANFLLRPLHQALQALPNAPCEYVGVWESSRPNCTYKITLQENGEFTAYPVQCAIGSDEYAGSWGVYDGTMIWLPNEGIVWPPDINPIVSPRADGFALIEKDGSRTSFLKIQDLRSPRCQK